MDRIMIDVASNITEEEFSKQMNPPEESNGHAYVEMDYKTGKKWIHCPFCGKKQYQIEDDTVIKNLRQKCKGSKCKKEFLVNV